MPKLKLDNNFINKLNSIHRQKLGKPDKIIKKKPRFKINKQETKKEIPTSPSPCLEHLITSPIPLITDENLKFRKLVMRELNDVNLMWESFDDNIKKIVLNEIIEKYYFYKNWKLNMKSFFLGILFTFVIIIVVKLLEILDKK